MTAGAEFGAAGVCRVLWSELDVVAHRPRLWVEVLAVDGAINGVGVFGNGVFARDPFQAAEQAVVGDLVAEAATSRRPGHDRNRGCWG